MTKALEEEIKQLEEQEAAQDDPLAPKEEQQEPLEEAQEDYAQEETEAPEEEKELDEAKEEPEEKNEEYTEDEIRAKQEAYRERRRKKQEEEERRQQELSEKAKQAAEPKKSQQGSDDELEQLKKFAQQTIFQQKVKQAARELEILETPFKEAFPDYDAVVSDAMEFSKIRLMNQGVSEAEAIEYLNNQKVLLADRAAAQGADPVEAVYNEAKAINQLFEQFAEKKGYKRAEGKPKTNMQALREVSKPSAAGSSGSGSAAAANKATFDEMEDLDEIGEVTIQDLMRQRK